MRFVEFAVYSLLIADKNRHFICIVSQKSIRIRRLLRFRLYRTTLGRRDGASLW